MITIDEIIEYFGTASEMARSLGTSRQVINQARRLGGLPSHLAIELERVTDGHFRAVDVKTTGYGKREEV